MTQQPTTSERFSSLCILYMFVAIIGVIICGILGTFIPLYRFQLFGAVLFFAMSLIFAIMLWICADSFDDIIVELRELLTDHWKRLTWREEAVVEE